MPNGLRRHHNGLFCRLNARKIVPYFMLGTILGQESHHFARTFADRCRGQFAGIWIVKTVPAVHFYRITYVLLFILGLVLFCEGLMHVLHGAL